MTALHETDRASGDNWDLLLGDSCERLAELDDNSVDLTVSSPPFAALFVYSDTERDLGNSSSRQQFLDHYSFIIRENLRVTKPGRIACVHVQQLTTTKAMHGYMGLTDFRGQVIAAYQEAGWYFHGEATIWKDPQAQSIRTRAHALAFQTKNRDSAGIRPALADYLLMFRKPGDNEVRIPHSADEPPPGVSNDDWISWASPIWLDVHDGADVSPEGEHVAPVWMNIRETRTLNERLGREPDDGRHICPLQLDFIERCVRLWSNPGELVLTPFAGIGSELYTAVKLGRRAVGIELKRSYWADAVKVLRALDDEMSMPSLFGVG